MKPFKKNYFTVDGNTKHEGYNLTSLLGLWNGYKSPGFTYEQAVKMLDVLKLTDGVMYEFDNTEFVTWNPLYPDHYRDVWVGKKYNTVDGELVLYPIGSWNWVWKCKEIK
jgi:hypothetical protein